MNPILTYDIYFGRKKDGIYDFSYTLADNFFELFPHPSVTQGQLSANVQLEKKTGLLILNFNVKGSVNLICDRCLDAFEHMIDVSATQYVKFANQYEELDVSTVAIPRNHEKINVAQWIYELIELNIPYKRIHPNDRKGKSTCNVDMVNKINILSNKKNQIEKDPRWEKLNTLLNQ